MMKDWVGHASRYLLCTALFRVASRRTPRASFEARGYPVNAASALGCRLWMESWQEGQTTRVLHRLLIMISIVLGGRR